MKAAMDIQEHTNNSNYVDNKAPLVSLSESIYAKTLNEIQITHMKALEETKRGMNIYHGKVVNDLHGTLELIYNQKQQLEFTLENQQQSHNQTLGSMRLKKDRMTRSYEMEMQRMQQLLEESTQRHVEDLQNEREKYTTENMQKSKQIEEMDDKLSTLLRAVEEYEERERDLQERQVPLLHEKIRTLSQENSEFQEQVDRFPALLQEVIHKREQELSGEYTAEKASWEENIQVVYTQLAELRKEHDDHLHIWTSQELERTQSTVSKETQTHEEVLIAKLPPVTAGVTTPAVRMRTAEHILSEDANIVVKNKVQAEYKKKIERLKLNFEKEKQDLVDKMSTKHAEDSSNRKQLFEDEIMVLLKEIDRLRRKLFAARVSAMSSSPSSSTRTAVESQRLVYSLSDLPSHLPITTGQKQGLVHQQPRSRHRHPVESLATPPSVRKLTPVVQRDEGPLSRVKSKDAAYSVRETLSRQYASQLDKYTLKNRTKIDVSAPKREKTKHHYRDTSSASTTATSIGAGIARAPAGHAKPSPYRYPTPLEYETKIYPTSVAGAAGAAGDMHRTPLIVQGQKETTTGATADGVDDAVSKLEEEEVRVRVSDDDFGRLRFPTPPEYRLFHQENDVTGVDDVDASELLLADKVSLLSYSNSSKGSSSAAHGDSIEHEEEKTVLYS